MKFCYNKLWKVLIDKGMKKKDLQKLTKLSPTTIAKLGRGGAVTASVLARICTALKCNVGDIVDIVP